MNGGSRRRHELDGITTVERQRQDLVVADDGAYARRLHVDERPGSLNGGCLSVLTISTIDHLRGLRREHDLGLAYVLNPGEPAADMGRAGGSIAVRPVRIREIVSRSPLRPSRGDVGSLAMAPYQ